MKQQLFLIAVGMASLLGVRPTSAQSFYEPYTLTTLAGSALNSGTNDNPGNSARFDQPWGVAVDGAHNVYVADTLNQTIRKITPGGVVTTLAGVAGTAGFNDGAASTALFSRPTGVAVNSAGTIVYVADYNNHLIRQISGGVVTTLAGSVGVVGTNDATGTSAQFHNPFGVAVNSADTVVYVADQNNQTIRMITVPGGVVSTLAGAGLVSGSTDGPNPSARFNTPRGIAVDSGGNVYVADSGNLTVRKILSSGGVSTLAGSVSIPGDNDGPGSGALFSLLNAAGPFGGPCGVAVDSASNVYVTDQGNHTIRKITPGASVTTLAGLALTVGSADGAGSCARLNYPAGVAVDTAGTLYVADVVNQTLRVGVNANPSLCPNLVVNGSFETTSPVVGANSFNNALDPTNGVPGWTTAANNVLEVWGNNTGGIPASLGRNQLEINAQSANETVSQVVTGLSTTCPVTFCFDYTGRNDAVGGTNNNDFTVILSSGGVSNSVALNPATYAVGCWVSFCTNFGPTASTATIAFRGHPHSAVASGAHIDNVLLTQCCATNLVPLALTCATNKTVQCGSVWNFDAPNPSDGCSGTNATVTVLSTVTNGSCPVVITRTWRATDACGTTNTCRQTVTVTDTTPPVLTCKANKTVNCGTAWTFDAPIASDTCSGKNLTITILTTVTNGICPQVITRTWVATDACRNTNTCSQTVTVVDKTPPVLACATNKTVTCGSLWDFDVPTTSDACSGTNVTISILNTETNGTPCTRVITRTWLVADACSNSARCSQKVTVVDKTPPVLICATNKTVTCGTGWNFDLPTAASDTCSGTNVTITILQTVTNGAAPCPQSITRTWLATDACGNTTTCRQQITVVSTNRPLPCVKPACVTFDFASATNGFTVDLPCQAGSPGVALSLNSPGPSGATNDFYLHATDLVGIALVQNFGNFNGNYLCLASNHCAQFCFDYRVFSDGASGQLDITPSFVFISDSDGPCGPNPPLRAQWVANFTVTENGGTNAGWHSICAPIKRLENGNLPSSAEGSWQMLDGSPNSDWDILLAAVTGLQLPVLSNRTEEVGYDNFCFSAPDCCVPVPSNMVLWLPFDETNGTTAANLYASGHNGTHVNGPSVTSGYVAHSLCFDGVSQSVSVPSYTAINFGTNNFSIDAWVKRDPASSNAPPRIIVEKRDPQTIVGYSLAVSFGHLLFQMGTDNYFYPYDNYADTATVPADNQWHFVAVTVNRVSTNGGQFYVDGNPTGTFNPTEHSGSLNNTNSFLIGNTPVDQAAPWLGCIDEVELFRRVLRPAEIAAIFAAGAAGKCKTPWGHNGYNGLFYETPVQVLSAGAFTLTTTNKTFSGSLLLGTEKLSFTGIVGDDGTGTSVIARKGKNSITVQFNLLAGSAGEIFGTVGDGDWTAQLMGEQEVDFNAKTHPVPQVGKYTLVIPGNTNAMGSPGGAGYGTLIVDAAGNVKLLGVLADGTKFTRSTCLSIFDRWGFYVAPKSGKTVALGWLTFDPTETDSDLSGDLIWIKLPTAGDKYYPDGFTAVAEALGSRYLPPPNLPASLAELSGGNLDGAFTLPIKFKTTATSGLLSGTFVNPVSGKTVKFNGVVLQKQNAGIGYFLGPDQSGQVLITP